MTKMIKIFSVIVLFTMLFSGCRNNASENSKAIQDLKDLLATSPHEIAGLTGEISQEEADEAAKIIHEYQEIKITKDFQSQWNNKTLVLGDKQLKFEYKKFGKKPQKGWSLYISMHGGGGAPTKVNDQQWKNQINLYQPAEGIYLAPRAPTDTWNLWHQAHIDDFFTQLIQVVDAFEDINTNRVYITGYSAGGDGTYQLAPRMADCFAAAAVMAGHPNDASPLGLRNLPFALHMGADDGAYRRNEIAIEWKVKLDELQKNDPEGYVHDVQIHEGMGHWMERKDTVAILWMAKYNRNAYPQKVVWKQSSVTHNRFYWLGVPEGKAQKKAEVIARVDGQVINIDKAEQVDTLFLNLNDHILDLDEVVTVNFKGKEIFNALPKRNISNVWKSFNERNDLEQQFSAQIQLYLK